MMAYVALGVIAWFAFACAWGHMLVLRLRRNHNRQLTSTEVDIVTRAGQEWFRTGRFNDKHIEELEALGNCEPGFWRKLVRQA